MSRQENWPRLWTCSGTTSASSTCSPSTASGRSFRGGWRRSSTSPPITARHRQKFTPNDSSTSLKTIWNRKSRYKWHEISNCYLYHVMFACCWLPQLLKTGFVETFLLLFVKINVKKLYFYQITFLRSFIIYDIWNFKYNFRTTNQRILQEKSSL